LTRYEFFVGKLHIYKSKFYLKVRITTFNTKDLQCAICNLKKAYKTDMIKETQNIYQVFDTQAI